MTARLVEWGTAERVFGGEAESGDLAVAMERGEGALLAVIDGLGHGPEAAAAAAIAAAVLRDGAEHPLDWLVRSCHQALHRTRGVVMALVSLHPQRSSWLGVGNIEGQLLRPGAEPIVTASLPQLGGIVGYQLPPLHVSPLSLVPDDTLILATDGLHPDFQPDTRPARPVQEIADGILRDFAKGDDDALVMVARYLGDGS